MLSEPTALPRSDPLITAGFLRLLTAEGRAAYREWRGEDGSKSSGACSAEDFNSACDAVRLECQPGLLRLAVREQQERQPEPLPWCFSSYHHRADLNT